MALMVPPNGSSMVKKPTAGDVTGGKYLSPTMGAPSSVSPGNLFDAYKSANTVTPKPPAYKSDGSAITGLGTDSTGKFVAYDPTSSYAKTTGLSADTSPSNMLKAGFGALNKDAYTDLYNSKQPLGKVYYMNGMPVDQNTYFGTQKRRYQGALDTGNQDLVDKIILDASKHGYFSELNGLQPTVLAPPVQEPGAGTGTVLPDLAQQAYDASEQRKKSEYDMFNNLYNSQVKDLQDQLQASQDANNVQNFLDQRKAYRNAALTGMDRSGVMGYLDQQLMQKYNDANQKARQDTQGKLNTLLQSQADRIANINANYSDKTLDYFKDKQMKSDAEQAKNQQDILKSQFDMKNSQDKQAYDLIGSIASSGKLDPTLLYQSWLQTGSLQGILDAAQKGNIPLSAEGRKQLQDAANAELKNDLDLSDHYGIEFSGGKPITVKGQTVKTYKAIQDEKDQAQQAADFAHRLEQDAIDVRLRNRQLDISQQNTNISKSQLALSQTKAAQEKSGSSPKGFNPQQQLNLVQDATSKYFEDQTEPFTDIYGATTLQKTGKVILQKEKESAYTSTIKSYLNSGDITPLTARVMFDNAGLPYPSWLPNTFTFSDLKSLPAK